MDPRIQASVPTTPHIDTNYVSGSFPAVRNRILSYVDPTKPARNNGIGVNNEGNFTAAILTWNAPAVVTPPAATAIGGGVIGVTPIVNLAQVGGLICNAGGAAGFNSPPVAVDDTTATLAGTAVTIFVLSNDSDANGDTLSVTGISPTAGGASATSITTTAGNSVSLAVNGNVTFTPVGTFSGTDTFFSVISDGQGGTATAKVTVNVNATNNAAPIARADTATTAEDSTGVTVNVRSNDTDANGDTLTITSVTQSVNGGTVTISAGSVLYVPRSNFNGTDTFTYTISDGKGGSATATVTVTVSAANDVPVAVSDTIEVTVGTTNTLSLLTNDTDIDGNALTVSSVTAATPSTFGTVSRNATTGVVRFVATNVSGNATFNYTISDGNGGTATGSVTVVVKALVVDVLSFSAVPEFRTTKGEWRIAGTGNTDGKTITVRLGTTCAGTVVGTSAPVTLGVWTLRVTGNPPNGNNQVTACSSGNGKVTSAINIRN
jgi:hypothetical protein